MSVADSSGMQCVVDVSGRPSGGMPCIVDVSGRVYGRMHFVVDNSHRPYGGMQCVVDVSGGLSSGMLCIVDVSGQLSGRIVDVSGRLYSGMQCAIWRISRVFVALTNLGFHPTHPARQHKSKIPNNLIILSWRASSTFAEKTLLWQVSKPKLAARRRESYH